LFTLFYFSLFSASEMTYIVSGGALNSLSWVAADHSLSLISSATLWFCLPYA